MTPPRCPSVARLAAAASGEDAAAAAHADDCARCADELAAAQRLRGLAAALRCPQLDRGRRLSLGASVLALAEEADAAHPDDRAAPGDRRPAVIRAALTLTLAAAAAVLVVLTVPRDAARPDDRVASAEPDRGATPAALPSPPTAAATAAAALDADRGAPPRPLPDDAAPATPGGRGGLGERPGIGGSGRSARILDGTAQIVAGDRHLAGAAGERWTWPEPAAPTHFQTGWAALRAGDHALAATELDLARAEPGVAEDATYWAAIAAQRGGDDDRARRGFLAFLAGYPGSARAGEAHLALARLLVATDPTAAGRHRDAALADPDPRVRAAAEALVTP